MTPGAGSPQGLVRSAQAFVVELSRGTTDTAVAAALRLLDLGVSPTRIALDVVAAALSEVGRRWHSSACTVADEHRATALADAALAALIQAAPGRAEHGRVVVVCADGEWHVLAARLAAACARWAGWDVEFLGGGLPSADLRVHVAACRADAVAITCATPLAFPGAARAVHACHSVGVPALVGGSCVTRARALALGAVDGGPSANGLPGLLAAAVATPAPAVGSVPVLPVDVASLLAAATIPASGHSPLTSEDDDAVDALVLPTLASALLVDDDRVFHDFVDWWGSWAAARRRPVRRLVGLLEQLAHAHVDRPADLLSGGARTLERAYTR